MPWAVEVYLATITINETHVGYSDDNDYGDGPDLAPREEFEGKKLNEFRKSKR